MKEPIVFVGSFEPRKEDRLMKPLADERGNLIRILQSKDIPVRIVNELWPRDTFVYYRRAIHRATEQGNYANGGYVMPFPKFTMACNGIGVDEPRELRDSPAEEHQKLKEIYGNEIELFPNPRIIMKGREKHLPHVDLVVLTIPERKVTFIDETYYLKNKKAFNDFCERRGFNLETAECDYLKPTWPCNSLVLPDEKDLLLFTCAQKNKDFASKLKKYDIQVIEVPFANNCAYGGGVHCASNAVPKQFEEEACRTFFE